MSKSFVRKNINWDKLSKDRKKNLAECRKYREAGCVNCPHWDKDDFNCKFWLSSLDKDW